MVFPLKSAAIAARKSLSNEAALGSVFTQLASSKHLRLSLADGTIDAPQVTSSTTKLQIMVGGEVLSMHLPTISDGPSFSITLWKQSATMPATTGIRHSLRHPHFGARTAFQSALIIILNSSASPPLDLPRPKQRTLSHGLLLSPDPLGRIREEQNKDQISDPTWEPTEVDGAADRE
jgi:hypothetical protein